MPTEAVRWNLISELISRTVASGQDVGRTKLQKLVYFLQDITPIEEYRYQLRHYGPYSAELSREVDTLTSLGFIRVEEDPTGYGYHIYPGSRAPERPADLHRYERAIDLVIRTLAPLELGQLEVMATIKFVDYALSNEGRRPPEPDVLRVVEQLKPHYHPDFIRQSYDLLQQIWRPQ
jgi:hypothetical protein